MSKPKPRKPRPVRVTCGQCRKQLPATPAAMLQAAADAINAARKAGLDLKVRHGVIECDEGLLLPLSDGAVVARTRQYTEFPPATEDDDLA